MKNQSIRQQAEEIHSKNLELERQNLRLAETLISEEEKAVLLREIHHRVKNNLQIGEHPAPPAGRARTIRVSSRCQRSPGARKGHGDGARTHLPPRSTSPASTWPSICASRFGHNRQVPARGRVQLDVQAHVPACHARCADPCLSLVVNELLTNSMKHAFLKGARARRGSSRHQRRRCARTYLQRRRRRRRTTSVRPVVPSAGR